jgi:hypothetical protein
MNMGDKVVKGEVDMWVGGVACDGSGGVARRTQRSKRPYGCGDVIICNMIDR